jgi:hypothetical protein
MNRKTNEGCAGGWFLAAQSLENAPPEFSFGSLQTRGFHSKQFAG